MHARTDDTLKGEPGDAASRRRTLVGTLTLIFVIAVVVAILFVVLAAVEDNEPVSAAIGAVTLVPMGVFWWRLMCVPGGRGWTLAFAVSSLGFTLIPDVGDGGFFLWVLGPLVLALFINTPTALLAVALTDVAGLVAILILYPDQSVGISILRVSLFTMLMVVGVGFGHTMRVAEDARAAAAAVGAELALANVALRRSLSLEREVVLAEERARSARELHDGLGHHLTLISMALEFAQRTREGQPERAWAEVGTAAETTRRAMDDMRLWVRALDPPIDAGLGGRAAFEAIVEAFRGTGLDVRVQHHGDEHALPAQVSLFATRFVQEGLTNVLRHSGAGVVAIEAVQSPAQLRLSIADDGLGSLPTGEGFGLRSLRERAELLGGSLTRCRAGLGGLELVAVLPLKQED